MKIKKVVLIEPKAPASHVYAFVKMPRLGLPLIGTQLKDSGCDVKLIYGNGGQIQVSDLAGADVVGISTTTSTCKEAYGIARYAREKGIPVIIGGVHATFMPEEALQYCDYVCRGEGDFTFIQLLTCLERGEAPLTVPGVSFKVGGKIRHNPLGDWVNVEECPVPDLSLFQNLRKIRTFPVMTSRGCPYRCTFCSVTQMFGHRYRCRTDDQVLAELEQYKGKNVFFCDDHFTANPERTKKLLKKMIESGILPKWWGAQVRADAAKDEELLTLMRKAKCGTVYVGMESINPETLKAYNKHQSVADIEYCVKRFHEFGIHVHGMFVFGGDDDTVETIRKTVNFALQARIDTVQFLILVPLPGTPVFKKLEQEGRLLTRNWNLYDGHHVVFRPQKMSPLELQTETIAAFKKFYSIKNLGKNLASSGLGSMVFRAAGYYLVRQWEKDNGWYQEFLKRYSENRQVKSLSKLTLNNTIESFKTTYSKYLSSKKLVDMHILERNDGIIVELQGYLNNFALKEVFQTVKGYLPTYYKDLTINAAKLAFASDDVVKKFIQALNELAKTAYNVKVKVPDKTTIMSVLERYDLTIPYFEC